MSRFANPHVLVDTQWVFDHLNDSNVRLLEVGWDTSEFESGHIPHAVAGWGFADIQQGDNHAIPNKPQIESMLFRAGISNLDTVVVYGGLGNLIGVMAFWLLKIYGHKDVRLLDGGRQKWTAEHRPLSTELPAIKPTQYVAQSPNMNLRADRDFIMDVLERSDYLFVDARPEDMYTGENNAGFLNSGHIPSAVNVPAGRTFDPQGEFIGWQTPTTNSDGTFKSAQELRALFAEKGISEDKNLITYCVRGGLSTHMWFVLTQLLGYSNVREYDLSWAEWGNLENVPVEK
ncbi:MAG TPA: sulfurtransferase [Anaerolineales bacterium]|nr:sulfurtransferase [Anaerolineales bacterium]